MDGKTLQQEPERIRKHKRSTSSPPWTVTATRSIR
jgi:hypothetical protein